MKSRRKMLSCILMACMGTVIGFAASAATNDVQITPPPKPAFSTEIKPGEVDRERDKHLHGHHDKNNIKKNKSNDVQNVSQVEKEGGRS